MEFLELNKGWKYISRERVDDDYLIPLEAEDISLPLDLLIYKDRNLSLDEAMENGFYPSCTAVFYKTLPVLKKSAKIYMKLEGVCGIADFYVNNILVKSFFSTATQLIDITDYYDYSVKNIVKISLTHPMRTGRYTGLGICGGATLISSLGKVYIQPNGLFVTSVIDVKASVKIATRVVNASSEPAVFMIEASVFNARKRRITKKLKKVKLGANAVKTFDITARLTRFYPFSPDDPYNYNVEVKLLNGEIAMDTAVTGFGICSTSISNKGLLLNNKLKKLHGTVIMHDNGILGNISTPEAEIYKLSRIKALGYNAVRYVGCPSVCALNALDKIGLYALVDIFDVWGQGKYTFDGHADFKNRWREDVENSIKTLRNHPSVVMYSIGNSVSESYNRGGGAELAAEIASYIRELDPSRPLTANAFELVPLRQEIDSAGGRSARLEGSFATSAINFGREKDLFKHKTAQYFSCVDVAGYSYLYPRYSTDKLMQGRMIIGLATYPKYGFDALEETEKNANVIGDFKYSGADYIGAPLGKPIIDSEQLRFIPPHTSYCGDLDLIYDRKPQAYYRMILNGNRSVSYITVTDPESTQKLSGLDHSVKTVRNLWNLPRYLGQKVEVEVYSGGEVVALYLDGKLIGRKLAGKVNKYIATFKTEFYPGKLEAVSFHKGAECSRTVLESATAPRAIKLTPNVKSVCTGEYCFIAISIVDKDGREVKFANREIEVLLTGEGRQVALGSADPESQNVASSRTCQVYDGKAMLIVSGNNEGKLNVKVYSDGLLSGKTAIKFKPTVQG